METLSFFGNPHAIESASKCLLGIEPAFQNRRDRFTPNFVSFCVRMETVRHDSGATQEERNAAFAELRDLGREIREISAQERNILLDKTFRELGYSGSDSAEIREAVKTIYSATEEWGGHGRHGRR